MGEKKKVIGESCDQTNDSTVIPGLNAQVKPQAVYFGHEQGCSLTLQVSSCLLSSDRGSSIWSKLQCVAYQLHLITMLPWVNSNHHPKSKNCVFSPTKGHKRGTALFFLPRWHRKVGLRSGSWCQAAPALSLSTSGFWTRSVTSETLLPPP